MVKHDDWWTKKENFDEWCLKYEITPKLDVSADENNHLCEKYFTKEQDALKQDWGDEDIWMNAPNSRLRFFIRKAYDEWLLHGMKQLWAIPCQTLASKAFIETVWKDFISQNRFGERIIIDPIFPRPVFLEHGEEPENAAARSYMAIVLMRHQIK